MLLLTLGSKRQARLTPRVFTQTQVNKIFGKFSGKENRPTEKPKTMSLGEFQKLLEGAELMDGDIFGDRACRLCYVRYVLRIMNAGALMCVVLPEFPNLWVGLCCLVAPHLQTMPFQGHAIVSRRAHR